MGNTALAAAPDSAAACSATAAERVPSAPAQTGSLLARIMAVLRDRSDDRVAQLAALNVFFVRAASAAIALGSQVLLARWMGRFEYGVFIYVWTWVMMIGSLSDLGLSSAARRFIPEYTELGQAALLRGFLKGGRRLAIGISLAIGGTGALIVYFFSARLDPFAVVPLYLACATIPAWAMGQIQAGIAQSYEWPNLAFIPFFIVRQLAMTVLIGAAWFCGAPIGAVFAMAVAMAASWMVTFGQSAWLKQRLNGKIAAGERRYDIKSWLSTSLPIFVVESFYLLLTYVDILALEHLASPREVAVYYAGARLLAVVAFVYFAIASATTHKFTRYHVAGDSERLKRFFVETARWTFWPSLALCVAILALGKPLLNLFGADFDAGYSAMFILAVGMLARAAVGPAERLLNMLGDRKPCAAIYALAFALNLVLCIVLIPRLGINGAAAATTTALVVESILLFATARRRLRHHTFLMEQTKPAGAAAA